ncbi:N-acetyltransferase [Anaerosinus massiliensis]|uniref:N-acetyltransferase n=1 Tax=Massilibacillus massiliensis TaxID=1806837 RepID=UPI000DA637D8|nr:N-acetyltransferase [Massilibacillus massiliensis]
MITKFSQGEINQIMEIWLDTNITAHHFIPEQYWQDHYNIVKEQYMPIAETFVYKQGGDSQVEGFISIIEKSFIGALFVKKESQGKGIGLNLIEHCKTLYPALELAVYVENEGAVKFYKYCGFAIKVEQMNADSGFREYIMRWEKQ